jgi:hypothetical protein
MKVVMTKSGAKYFVSMNEKGCFAVSKKGGISLLRVLGSLRIVCHS